MKGILVRNPGPTCLLYFPTLRIIDRSYCFIIKRNDATIDIIPSIVVIMKISIPFNKNPKIIPKIASVIPSARNPAEPPWLTTLSNEINEDCSADIFELFYSILRFSIFYDLQMSLTSTKIPIHMFILY